MDKGHLSSAGDSAEASWPFLPEADPCRWYITPYAACPQRCPCRVPPTREEGCHRLQSGTLLRGEKG